MKWDYKEKKRLHSILRRKVAALEAGTWVERNKKNGESIIECLSRQWNDYVDGLGCTRIVREGYSWREQSGRSWTNANRRIHKKGFVSLSCPLLSTTHVVPTRGDGKVAFILLVPEELAEKIVVLGEAPP